MEEALADHENHEAEECELETFARDVLGCSRDTPNSFRMEGPPGIANTKTYIMPDASQKYAIVVDGDSLEAVEEAAHLLYLLLGRTIRAHRRDHAAKRASLRQKTKGQQAESVSHPSSKIRDLRSRILHTATAQPRLSLQRPPWGSGKKLPDFTVHLLSTNGGNESHLWEP